jgi:sec-independent protein translocase protein TatA
MLNNIGTGELIVIVLVLLILFGGKKLPELARGMGESARELQKAKRELENSFKDKN